MSGYVRGRRRGRYIFRRSSGGRVRREEEEEGGDGGSLFSDCGAVPLSLGKSGIFGGSADDDGFDRFSERLCWLVLNLKVEVTRGRMSGRIDVQYDI